MFLKKTLITLFVLTGACLSVVSTKPAWGQEPCDIPFPDSCQIPIRFCPVPPENCPWDLNGLDLTYLVAYLRGGPPPHPYSKYDVNCDGVLNQADVAYLTNYFRHQGPPPFCCFYDCQSHPQTSAVGDRVWLDVNINGVQDPVETTGVAGIPVDLLICSDPPRVLASDTTDSDGLYHFEALEAGNYKVGFHLTDEYGISPKDQGTNDSLDSDVNPENRMTDCFELSEGVIDNTRDLGLYLPAFHADIGDFVWNDLNRNGIQDTDEPGLPDVRVIIYSCENQPMDTTRTDSTGHYIFHDEGIARAYLHFVLPDGFRFGPMNRGNNDSLDSDANPETGNTTCFEIPEGDPILVWDAGMYRHEQFEGCTWQLAWWKNHAGFGPQPDSVSRYLPLWLGLPDSAGSIHVTTNQIAIAVLRNQGQYGRPFNGITRLYAQLLAAKLNIANGASDGDVAETIMMADTFLAMHDWHDWDGLGRQDKLVIFGWVNMLVDYNNGLIGPGRCGADEQQR
jgi:hypothetical protein